MPEENIQPVQNPSDHEADKNKLEELEKKCEEYLNNWKRAAADFMNYKKDEVQRAGILIKYAKEDILLNMLPITDSIYLLEKHTKVEGIELIKKQIEEFLKKEGIEEIETEGKQFNPETMEVIEQTEEGESGVVSEELQKGYKMGEQVIRAAKVKVSK